MSSVYHLAIIFQVSQNALIAQPTDRRAMKFVAFILTAIAACSSSTPANDEGPVSQQAGLVTRSLRGRQKRRPCAKSIATYCTTAKNAAR